MASTDRSQKDGYPKNVDTGSTLTDEQSTNRTTLRSRFAAGNVISASDFNTMRTVLNAFQRHYHRYDDYIAIHTYGNNGGTNGPYDRDTSLVPGYTDPGSVTAGTTALASHYTNLASGANVLQSHNHTIDDN